MTREEAPARSRAVLLFAVAGLGVFFAADDQTTVVAVLPQMITDIGLPQDQFYRAAWIINGYILGYVIAMPLMGRVADTYGHALMFAVSLVVFMAGSAGVALADDLTTVSVIRGIQAVGGGAVVPIAMAIAADALPAERRALGIGAIAAASEAGGLIGPLWGGGITELIGWRGVFWINLPMCMPLAAAAFWLARDTGTRHRRPVDVAGGALFGASLVCLTLALTNDPIEPRPAVWSAALFAGALALFALFLVRQIRTADPLVDLRLFTRRPIAAGFLATVLHGGVTMVAMINIPLFTNIVLNGSALEGGINLTRMTVGVPLGAIAGGFIAIRFGFNRTGVLGAALMGLGFLGMSSWGSDPGVVAFTLPPFATGVGLGLVIAPVGAAVMNEVAEGFRASISSLLTVVDLTGSLVGIALLTTRGLSGFYASAGLIPLDDPRYAELIESVQIESFGETFFVTAGICLAVAGAALFLGRGPIRRMTWRDVWLIP
jgi:MFS family permease